MDDKKIRKISKKELLEILLSQSKRIEELEAELKKTNNALETKKIIISESGTLAEASLKLNGMFESAELAIEQYKLNIEEQCKKMISDTKKECKIKQETIIKDTQEKCEKKEAKLDEKLAKLDKKLLEIAKKEKELGKSNKSNLKKKDNDNRVKSSNKKVKTSIKNKNSSVKAKKVNISKK